jgi:hypothetical protein
LVIGSLPYRLTQSPSGAAIQTPAAGVEILAKANIRCIIPDKTLKRNSTNYFMAAWTMLPKQLFWDRYRVSHRAWGGAWVEN